MVPLEKQGLVCFRVSFALSLKYRSLLIAYSNGDFAQDYIPTVLDNIDGALIFRDKRLEKWSGWDTAGQQEYTRIRTLSYPGTNMFLVVFAVCNRGSFDSVTTKWIPELRHSGPPNTPILLVGTQSDRRGKQQQENEIELAEIQEKVKEIGAIGYVECSSMYGTGLREIFDTAMEYISSACVLETTLKKQKKKDCKVM